MWIFNPKQHMKTKFNINQFNVEGYEPHEVHPLSFPFFTFAYMIEGEALVEIDGKNILLGPGQFILAPENSTIVIKHSNCSKGFNGRFSIDFLKDASYQILRSTTPTIQSFWFDDAVFMAALMKRMVVANEDRDHHFLQSALDLIIGQLHPKDKVAVVPEKLLQMVFDSNKAPLSVSEYAEMLNVTANYLNKTVKSHTHRTAIDWIEIARLNQAKMLLKDRSVPIVDVAVRCGLDDQSYFSRFFKKKTGMTPSQFRNSL